MAAQIPLIYDELLDYLAEKAAPEEILAFKASEKAQERAEYLLDKNNAGTLTPEEYVELQQMLYFDGRVSVLKARAALALKQR
jgi:hypothetical protein